MWTHVNHFLFMCPDHERLTWLVCISLPGMDIINDALEAAVQGKDRNEWTPVSVNVAPATLTILSKQVTAQTEHHTWEV